MDETVNARLQIGDVAFDAADADLLRAVAREHSVSGATDALGRSRSRALSRIETLEDAFGALVTRQRGGATGGGSELTARAHDLLARFDRARATLDGTANAEECVIHGTLVDRHGDLCTVDTDAGTVRARFISRPDRSLSADRRVQVGVRSDTVTLHEPTDAPAGDATSARNRFRGSVLEVDTRPSIGRVAVDIGPDDPLVALLTDESLGRLALETGDLIVASFKATATRALPV